MTQPYLGMYEGFELADVEFLHLALRHGQIRQDFDVEEYDQFGFVGPLVDFRLIRRQVILLNSRPRWKRQGIKFSFLHRLCTPTTMLW